MSIEIVGGTSGVKANTSAEGALYVTELESETFLGTYQAELIATVASSAQTANTGGFFWGVNPIGSGKIVKIERMGFQAGPTTAVAAGFPTAPRIGLTKFTFTGTASGATVATNGTASTQGKFDSTYPAPVFDWRSAITGLTCTHLQMLFSTLVPAIPIVGTVSTSQIMGICNDNEYQPRESEYEHIIRPGEGIVLFQPEAGSTSDTRKVTARVFWEEVTVP